MVGVDIKVKVRFVDNYKMIKTKKGVIVVKLDSRVFEDNQNLETGWSCMLEVLNKDDVCKLLVINFGGIDLETKHSETAYIEPFRINPECVISGGIVEHYNSELSIGHS